MSGTPSTTAWRHGELRDLVFFQRGFDITKAEQEPGQYPVISSSGITSYHTEFKAHGPGVVIGRKGTLGSVHYADGDYWPHDTTLWSKDLKGNNARFVYYYLQTMNLKRFDVGNSNPTLNRNHIHDIPVVIPTRALQDRIAAILSAYDGLIDTNSRRMTLLADAGRRLYREWFVRLRFPGHEHVSNVDGIPEGWERAHLARLVETQYGYTETASAEPIGPRFLRGTDINKQPYIDWAGVPYCDINESDQRKYQLFTGDILIVRMADPGKVAIVERELEAVFASYLIRVTPLEPRLRPYYLFHVLSSDEYQAHIRGVSTGATRKTASAPLLVDFELLLPTDTLVRLFEQAIVPMRAQITTLLQANERLSRARDLLVSRIMSRRLAV